MKWVKYILFFMFFSVSSVFAQDNKDLLDVFKWRGIGPANPGGRISDIEGIPGNHKIIYAGAATGGIWKTVNAAVTWEQVFGKESVGSVGDLAVFHKNPDIVYVGTGEANGRNSSPWGNGVYKTTDGGKSWTHLGLKETHHIGRVLIHPNNSDIVYVAATGHLWGENPERGLYKTTNGGKSWDKVLYINDQTGVIDVAFDGNNPEILYAAAYERLRDGFSDGDPIKKWGEGSGVYVSTNAGKSWDKSTKGLPDVQMGRIGLSCVNGKGGWVYAIVEAETLKKDDERSKVKKNKSGIFRTKNKGKSWEYMGDYNNRPFYYSQIRAFSESKIYAGGFNLMYSDDAGKSFVNKRGSLHVDVHAAWIDPQDHDRVLVGSDGGIGITYDGGDNWDHNFQMSLAQFYAITADMRKPYFVYGGLQDNDSWGGPSKTRSIWGIRNRDWFSTGGGDGFYSQADYSDLKIIYSSSQNGNIRRVDFRTGAAQSIKPDTTNVFNFRDFYPDYQPPKRDASGGAGFGFGGGSSPFRFDWNSPLLLSMHNPNTLYLGGQNLFKSVNRGDDWTIISPDLTSFPKKSSAIVSIDESVHDPDVIWVGTNDGNVWLTKDDGVNWTKLNKNIPMAPEKYWVKRIEVSNHKPGRAYLVFDGHRNDDTKPYVFATEDFGETWYSVVSNLPDGSVYVVREDDKNENLLIAGTEFRIFVSLDRGNSWSKFMNELPTVPVHDIFIHPREGDFIAGTHGQGAFIADNINPLRELNKDILEKDFHLFTIRPEMKFFSRNEWEFQTDKEYRAKNPSRGTSIFFNLKSVPEKVQVTISDLTGKNKFSTLLMGKDIKKGINKVQWNFGFDGPELQEKDFKKFDEAVQNSIKSMTNAKRKAELEEAHRNFHQTPKENVIEKSHWRKEVVRLAAGRQTRGVPGFGRGTVAEPGKYMVQLTVNGVTQKRILVIEKDNAADMRDH